MNFTDEEHFHLTLTKICCDYDVDDISSEEAMKQVMQLNIDRINQVSQKARKEKKK